MSDLLSTSVSGLLAFQRAINTTGHNIANASTAGYSRQRVDLATRTPHMLSNGWAGTGVDVASVQRVYDNFLTQQVRSSASSFERFSTYAAHAERVSNLFANSGAGLTSSLQKLANAIQSVADSPSSISARHVMLSEAQAVADRLRDFDAQLTAMDNEMRSRLMSETGEINSLGAAIAELNTQISAGTARNGQPPNDLLDQRDRLVEELSRHVNVSAISQSDGALNVFIGGGQALVLGGAASKLVTQPDAFDVTRTRFAIETTNGVSDVTDSLTGGTVGGLLDFRREVLDPARNALGRLSIGLATTINEQHRSGIDLTGTFGQDLFAVGDVSVNGHRTNTGTASLAASRSDVGALTESDYILEYTSGGWAMRREAGGAAVALTGTGTVADPLRADGLEIVVSGAAAVGDRFLVRPTRGAAAGLDVLIDDPAHIAAAAPIRTGVTADNTGTGEISAGEVLDASNPQLRDPVTIEFLTPTTYSVNGAGSFNYTSGEPIELNGWRIAISGTPAVGDQFTVSDNSNGAGDNRNALALAAALSRPVFDNGTASIDQAATRLVGNVGSSTRQAQLNRDTQSVLHQESIDARDGVSGVNLDEEAANLLHYQHAYQAAAQLIQIASTLFDTLLAASSRR